MNEASEQRNPTELVCVLSEGGRIYWGSLGKCRDLVLARLLGSTRRVLAEVLVTPDLGRLKDIPSVSMTTKEPTQTMGRF